MNKIIILISFALLAASCSSVLRIQRPDIESFKTMLGKCETDIENARRVILSRDLIKNLTHLQRMDSGGDKYYLLEREGITDMIRAVTGGTYSDFILINRGGTVVYTMNNNAIFARNVLTSLAATALRECYENHNTSPFITAVPFLPLETQSYLAVSGTISGPETVPGIFILLVDMKRIVKMIGGASSLINLNGNYIVAADAAKIQTRFPDFDRIDLSGSEDESTLHHFTTGAGARAEYRFVRYGSQTWVLVRTGALKR